MKIFNELRLRFEKVIWVKSPELAVIDTIIDLHPEIINILSEDILAGLQNNNYGRKDNPTVEQIVRAAIYKELKKISYEDLEFAQYDSQTCQMFLRLKNKAFSRSTLQDYISKIKAENLRKVMIKINKIGIELGYEDCQQIREDSTNIETNIQHPTNNSLVYDCVKTATFFLEKICENYSNKYIDLEDRRAKAKKINYQINNVKISCKDKESQKEKKQETMRALFNDYLIILKDIQTEIQALIKNGLTDYSTKDKERIINLDRQIEKVYKNAYQFQIEGIKIKNEDKIFSIYEEHTDILVKGIRDIVFGHKVNLATGVSNLILYCNIEKGNPKDTQLFKAPIVAIKKEYETPILSIVTDGGYASIKNVAIAQKEGIKNIVFNKLVGSLKSITENEEIEKTLKKWRAGIEAVISNLKRGFDLRRVIWKGEAMFEAKVLWSVIGYNIRVLTGHITNTLKLSN